MEGLASMHDFPMDRLSPVLALTGNSLGSEAASSELATPSPCDWTVYEPTNPRSVSAASGVHPGVQPNGVAMVEPWLTP